MLVIEGPDCSGKSTLADYLGKALAVPVQHSEGPARSFTDMANRLTHYNSLPPETIFDRHPCISDPIYSSAMQRPLTVTAEQVVEFYKRKPLMIYCHPPLQAYKHITKEHDTPEHLRGVVENHRRIVATYRVWAAGSANVIYRIGDDMDWVLHCVTDFVADIARFHNHFEIDYTSEPRHLRPDLRDFRVTFMAEELCEYAGIPEVTKQLIQSALRQNTLYTLPELHDQFDALIDLIYVALGTAHLHGFRFREGWARVHRANMLKRRVTSAGDSKRGHIADVSKPPGWTPPDLSDLVRGR